MHLLRRAPHDVLIDAFTRRLCSRLAGAPARWDARLDAAHPRTGIAPTLLGRAPRRALDRSARPRCRSQSSAAGAAASAPWPSEAVGGAMLVPRPSHAQAARVPPGPRPCVQRVTRPRRAAAPAQGLTGPGRRARNVPRGGPRSSQRGQGPRSPPRLSPRPPGSHPPPPGPGPVAPARRPCGAAPGSLWSRSHRAARGAAPTAPWPTRLGWPPPPSGRDGRLGFSNLTANLKASLRWA